MRMGAAILIHVPAEDRVDERTATRALDPRQRRSLESSALSGPAGRRHQGSAIACMNPPRVPTYTVPSHTAGVDSTHASSWTAQSSGGSTPVSETS